MLAQSTVDGDVAVQMLCFSFDIFNSINYVNFLWNGKAACALSLTQPTTDGTQRRKKCTAFISVHNKFNELTVQTEIGDAKKIK